LKKNGTGRKPVFTGEKVILSQLDRVCKCILKWIPGCNSAKKLIFFKKKVATLSLKITIPLILRISGDFRMS
jgi:hypothetical protein